MGGQNAITATAHEVARNFTPVGAGEGIHESVTGKSADIYTYNCPISLEERIEKAVDGIGNIAGLSTALGLLRNNRGKGTGNANAAAKAPENAAKAGPYSHLPDHPSVGSGKNFTQSQKKKFLAENEKANSGTLRDDVTGEKLVRPQKHTKDVRPPDNEAHIDHVYPRSKGGTNSSSNAQVRSRKNNLEKSDN